MTTDGPHKYSETRVCVHACASSQGAEKSLAKMTPSGNIIQSVRERERRNSECVCMRERERERGSLSREQGGVFGCVILSKA